MASFEEIQAKAAVKVELFKTKFEVGELFKGPEWDLAVKILEEAFPEGIELGESMTAAEIKASVEEFLKQLPDIDHYKEPWVIPSKIEVTIIAHRTEDDTPTN